MIQTFDGLGCVVDLDLNDPKDRLESLRKQQKVKDPKTLTPQEKVNLFDAYVDAGVITL